MLRFEDEGSYCHTLFKKNNLRVSKHFQAKVFIKDDEEIVGVYGRVSNSAHRLIEQLGFIVRKPLN